MRQGRLWDSERPRGFTLIELLIVVAIIAILAAIAVPNFMEAQTRAKVAHVMANMRSLAVAIEAYKTDTNSYPLDWQEIGRRTGAGRTIGWDEVLFVLTTPVAYISSIPADPFVVGGRLANVGSGLVEKVEHRYSWYVSRGGFAWNHYSGVLYPGGYFYPPHDHFRYLLASPGPDLWVEFLRDSDAWADASPLPYSGDTVYYDPTNGSMSQGDIIMYGPGNAFNPPPPTDYPNGRYIKDWFIPYEPGYPL
jgi:type II secretion system protein G